MLLFFGFGGGSGGGRHGVSGLVTARKGGSGLRWMKKRSKSLYVWVSEG